MDPLAGVCWDVTFNGASDEELADVWYALSGAEIRHTGCFAALVDSAYAELLKRKGDAVAPFLDQRFRPLRAVDTAEDVAATAHATEAACQPVDEQHS